MQEEKSINIGHWNWISYAIQVQHTIWKNKIKQQHSRGFSILYNHTIGNNNKEKKYFWNIYKYAYKSEKQNGTSMSISKLIWWHVGQKYHTLFLHTVLVSVQRNLLQNQYKSDLCQFHLTRSTSTSLGMN